MGSLYTKNSQESDFSFTNLKIMNESLKGHSKLLSLIFMTVLDIITSFLIFCFCCHFLSSSGSEY